jgi:transaldolase
VLHGTDAQKKAEGVKRSGEFSTLEAEKMDRLQQLVACGQSYWLDNLTRRMINTGELQKRVTEQGLRGITSNPNTFHKAIAKGNDYDTQVEHLFREKRTTTEVYEGLVVTDVQEACDILRPVYDETDSGDGFVSLEVSPHLAHDPEGTMEEVRHLWILVNRPNVFIKIPGTAAGVPAIEQMLYEGININITLLFSAPRYETVAWAYIKALERRMVENKPVKNVASVASFFLSRIDVLVDQLLSHLIRPKTRKGTGPYPEALLGKVAIANAKLAYQSFKRIFRGEPWQALERKGARVQRPLWASTSTKNPEYRDIRYVEPLIGPYTVNTMPEETIAAFADHGVVQSNSIEADLEEAQQVFQDLETSGVNFNCVTWQLENEGVQKFIEPYDMLMDTLNKKRQQLLDAA